MSEEDNKTITVRSLSLTLSEGREVHVGWNLDNKSEHSYYLLFMCEGRETRIKISPECYDALILLKPQVDLYRKTGSTFRWVACEPAEADPAPEDA